MTIYEMMNDIIIIFGHESDEAVGFCDYAESGASQKDVYATYIMILNTYGLEPLKQANTLPCRRHLAQ